MIKKLTTIGNSLGLIIEQPILELLAIEQDTPLEMTTDGEVLIIRPVRTDHHTRVQAMAQRLMDVHDATLKRLAD
jgi:antitoxin MazE